MSDTIVVLLVVALPAVAGEFRDCEVCPVMVTIPAGSFLMGTAEADRLIDPRTGKPATNDGPQHEVTIAAPFAIGKYEVTVAEFGAFVAATGHETSNGCMEFSKENSFTVSEETDWNAPGFEQAPDAPVGCVSVFDAQAYADWLSEKTGEPYRLPSEAEWEYAARAGATTPYHWDSDEAAACDHANVRSAGAHTISKRQAESDVADGFPCDDGFALSAPVGSFAANGFGLYDVQGNNWEWVLDCNHASYEGAPTDGSAWLDAEAGCRFGVIRGGSYLNRVERSSVTVRAGRPPAGRATNMGFRIVRASAPAGAGGQPPATMTRDASADSAPAELAEDARFAAGAELFDDNCAACHVEPAGLSGVYGTDQTSVEAAVRDGGNNVMSMPSFADFLTEEEISQVAAYVRAANGWE